MGKTIKWLVILVGALLVFVFIALLIVPSFVSMDRYKPLIAEQVSEATGRPFTLEGDLRFSLLPRAAFSLSGLRLGNPGGFKEKDLLTVQNFDVRVKLLPLLFGDVEVNRFVLESPHLVLERRKDGRGNWEGLGKASVEAPGQVEAETPPEGGLFKGLPIRSLDVAEFLIQDASILWLDQVENERKEITGLTLRLEGLSLDRPVGVILSAQALGQPLALEGKVGPLGQEPGKGTIPLQVSFKAAHELDVNLQGSLKDLAAGPALDLSLEVAPFSPKRLFKSLDQTFVVDTADPDALHKVAFTAQVKGDLQSLSIREGVLNVDASKMTVSAQAKDFTKPDIAFEVTLDQMDVDRYLPATSKQASAQEAEREGPAKAPTDFAPLRSLVLAGTFQAEELKVSGAVLEELNVKVSAQDGHFLLEPVTAELYEGDFSAEGSMDVRQKVPKIRLGLDAQGIRAGPLLRDMVGKGFLEGTVQAQLQLAATGDGALPVMRSLNGSGKVLFQDGAIKGLDLTSMVRNIQAAFGLVEPGKETVRTDFTEIQAPFTISNGIVKTANTTLTSPALRVKAFGEANLVREELDLRVEPRFVASLSGQGDTERREGVMVPVLVTGSFGDPKFRPDLEGMMRKELQQRLPQPSDLIKKLPGQPSEEGQPGALEDKAKKLLEQLPFGRQ